MVHHLKINYDFAKPVRDGDKRFEVRLNDRGFQKGDIVIFDVIDNKYKIPLDDKLNSMIFIITYVLNGWGIKEDYCVFGFKEYDGVITTETD